MTLKELMAWPKDLSLEEYEALLKKQQRLTQKMKRLANKILDEEDSMSVFESHTDPRYLEHERLWLKYKAELEVIRKEVTN